MNAKDWLGHTILMSNSASEAKLRQETLAFLRKSFNVLDTQSKTASSKALAVTVEKLQLQRVGQHVILSNLS